MSDPYVREVGSVTGLDGESLHIGVDYDSVAVHFGDWTSDTGTLLDAGGQEELGRLLVSAAWQAGQQKARMDGEPGG